MKRRRNVYLPKELIHEIFLRLPVKALLRFKSVCKEWCALTGSQSLIDGHFGHESNQDSLLIQIFPFNSQEEGTKFTIHTDDEKHLRMDAINYISNMPFGDNPCDLHLLGPVNGVFCLVRPLLGRVALFNPATRKFKPLPLIPLLKLRHLEFGFEFDTFSGDYKVVVFEVERESERSFCVYNSSSDSWRKAEVGDSFDEIDGISGRVLLNGVFHWIIYENGEGFHTILSFDMKSENFQEIHVPEATRYFHTLLMVDNTTYGDSLALLILDEDIHKCIDKWVMGRDGSWTWSFSIAIPQPYVSFWPLFVWKNNELLLEIQTETELHAKTLSLCLCDMSTQKLRILRSELYDVDDRGIFSYKESLVSFRGERDRAADCVQDFFD